MVPERKFDLQAHSTYSDGALAPPEVVKAAAAAGVSLLALSDHDTVKGLEEALATAADLSLDVIPAVELSTADDGYEDLHILGYAIDHADQTLASALDSFREDRADRAVRIVARLREEVGFQVDAEALTTQRAGKPVGRPHIAEAVVNHPANGSRLTREGITDVSSFIAQYLVPGAPAFVGRTSPTVETAIQLVHGAGGVAVWAHPFWDVRDPAAVLGLIERFRRFGLDGVEVFYPTHDRAQVELLHDACVAGSMLATGSSDFHGPDHRLFYRFLAYKQYGKPPLLGPLSEQP